MKNINYELNSQLREKPTQLYWTLESKILIKFSEQIFLKIDDQLKRKIRNKI